MEIVSFSKIRKLQVETHVSLLNTSRLPGAIVWSLFPGWSLPTTTSIATSFGDSGRLSELSGLSATGKIKQIWKIHSYLTNLSSLGSFPLLLLFNYKGQAFKKTFSINIKGRHEVRLDTKLPHETLASPHFLSLCIVVVSMAIVASFQHLRSPFENKISWGFSELKQV